MGRWGSQSDSGEKELQDKGLHRAKELQHKQVEMKWNYRSKIGNRLSVGCFWHIYRPWEERDHVPTQQHKVHMVT